MIAGTTILGMISPKAWGAIGVALVLGIAASAVGIQTARLHHAKADLAAARAAQLDPATHRRWQAEATAAVRNLGTCQANTDTLSAALSRQEASQEAIAAAGARTLAAAVAASRAHDTATAAAIKEAARILAPAPTDGDCQSGLAVIHQAIP